MQTYDARKASFPRCSVLLIPVAFAAISGCTALGPMAATTGIAPVPVGRPGIEGTVGVVPGHYLSAGVQAEPKGASIGQAALLVEPDDILRVPGLVIGGRYVGSPESGGYPEPMAGYRTYLGDDHRLALSAIGFATHGSGSRKDASYSATRGGAEAAFDVRLTPEYEWFELHVGAAAQLTGISAKGSYCVDSNRRFGADCPDPGDPPGQRIDATAGGFYPAGTGTIAIDVGRRLKGEFHGGRVALMGGGGTMPRVVNGQQEGAQAYGSAGLTLTLGFGEGR